MIFYVVFGEGFVSLCVRVCEWLHISNRKFESNLEAENFVDSYPDSSVWIFFCSDCGSNSYRIPTPILTSAKMKKKKRIK